MLAYGILIGLIVGGAIGAGWREIHTLKKKFIRTTEERKTAGVVTPAYIPPNETKQSSTVVRPKSPQQMEVIANERMRKSVLGL